MNKTVHIPKHFMKRYRKDKILWELFVFAVCVKMQRSDSRISADIKDVRKLMGCSYYKAVRMIEGAKAHPELFYIYENGRYIVARSFTHGRLKKRIIRTRTQTYISYSEKCFRFEYDPSEKISHIGVSRRLRDLLIKNAIMAAEQADGSTPINNSSRPSEGRPVTLHRLANISGYHHTTVRRHLKKMETKKQLRIYAGGLVPVLHCEDGVVLTDKESLLSRKNYFEWRGVRFVLEPNRYELIRPQKSDYAVNVIFNHRKRHRQTNLATFPKQRKNENDADFKNRTSLGHLWL